MVKKHSIPCYVANGGEHNIVNVPLGIFTRLRLRRFVQQLLKSAQQFETMFVVKFDTKDLQLLQSLDKILSLNLKPKSNRAAAKILTAAGEKNLKPTARQHGKDEFVNLVELSVSLGLIVLLFIVAAHIEYVEALSY